METGHGVKQRHPIVQKLTIQHQMVHHLLILLRLNLHLWICHKKYHSIA